MDDKNSADQTAAAVSGVEKQPKGLSTCFHDQGLSVWPWTGFGEKKLWDRLRPVVIPLVLASGAFYLQEQPLSAAFLNHADLLAPNRNGTYLQGDELSESKLYAPKIYDAAPGYSELDYANLDYSKLDYAKVDYAKLDYSKLDYAKVDYSKLDYSKLDYAKVDYSKLDYSKLDKTKLGR